MQAKPSNRTNTAAAWYVKNAGRIAFWILSLWCLLPVVMSAYDFIMCALGKFPSDATIEIKGFYIGYINYMMAIDAYYMAFRVLGMLTLVYALFTVAVCRDRVFRRESIRAMPWFYLLLGVLGWAILSSLLSGNPLYAFIGENYLHDGLLSYFIYGGVFACASMIREERHRRNILWLYCAVTVYLAVIMIVQEFSHNDFLNHCFPSFRAVVFNQFNHFGYVLCMGVMALTGLYLYDRRAGAARRGAYLLGFALLTYAVLVNNTFGAYLASLVALPVVYVFYRRAGNRLTLPALLPGIVFLALSVMNCLGLTPGARTLLANLSQFGIDIKNIATGAEEAAYAGTGRMTLWKDTIERIGQRPLFGFGPMGFYGENAITNGDSTHNEYLQIAGFLGIPALVMYLGAILTLTRRQWLNIRRLSPMILAVAGVTVGYLFSAFFGNPVFNTAPFFWMALGMTTADAEAEPLLSPDIRAIAAGGSTSNRKRLVALAVIGIVVLVGLVGASMVLSKRTENGNELADLQCMRGAEITALRYNTNNKLDENTSYWYDANNFTLIPENEERPLPYGKGTALVGGAVAAFNETYDAQYDYFENTDYREKIILVTVGSVSGDNPEIRLEWK